MFLPKQRPRRFDYNPRYYDPSKDEQNRRRRHFKFESNVRRGGNRPLIVLVILFILVYFLYQFMM